MNFENLVEEVKMLPFEMKLQLKQLLEKVVIEERKIFVDALRKGEIGLIDDPEEEQEILEAFETGKLMPIENREEKNIELIEAARNNPV